MRKRKNKIIFKIFISVFIIGIIILNITKTQAKSISTEKIQYSHQSFYDEKDDGWVYVFEIYYPDNETDRAYMFDGYNLKYKELEGYYVPVINAKTSEELYRVTPEYITLSISEKHKNDITKIVDFFNKKQFNNEISVNELEQLDITTIDKSYLAHIFNNTLKSELKKEPGKYYNSNYVGRVNMISNNPEMPGEWQASYILNFGEVYKVNIEFIDKNGNYLKNKNLTDNEQKLINQIETAESIAEMEEFYDLSNKIIVDKISKIDNDDLKSVLKELNQKLIGNDTE